MLMTVYGVIFMTTINAKSKSDMERKAEILSAKFTEKINKPVVAMGYATKEDKQQKLI